MVAMPLDRAGWIPATNRGNDGEGPERTKMGGRTELGEKFLIAVIPAVVGGDPSEEKSEGIS